MYGCVVSDTNTYMLSLAMSVGRRLLTLNLALKERPSVFFLRERESREEGATYHQWFVSSVYPHVRGGSCRTAIIMLYRNTART